MEARLLTFFLICSAIVLLFLQLHGGVPYTTTPTGKYVSAPSPALRSARSAQLRGKTAAVALARVLQSVEELVEAGGVYIYPSDQFMAKDRRSLFYRSGKPHMPWVDGVDMYSIEYTLLRYLQASPYVTRDAAMAALFFVPQYALHETVYFLGTQQLTDMQGCALSVAVEYLLPFIHKLQLEASWTRRGGRDHLFVFPWDEAWDRFPGVAEALANSNYFGFYGDASSNLIPIPAPVPQTWSTDETIRNVVYGGGGADHFVAHLLHPSSRGKDSDGAGCSAGSSSAAGRTILASFIGTIRANREYSHGIRQDLLEKYGGDKGIPFSVIISDKHTTSDEYKRVLQSSAFCLCPPGWAPWSPRLFAVMARGCIPVLFAEEGFTMPLPFDDLIDWASFVVTIPPGSASDIVNILSAIPEDERCRMRSALAQWAPFVSWSGTPHLTLLFTLHEAWQRVRPASAG